jgi:hypothetical protein
VARARQKKRAPAASRTARQPAKDQRLKKWLGWIGGIATAVVTALSIASVTGLWHYLTDKQPPAPKGQPVTVASVDIDQCLYSCGGGNTFVFPQNVVFSASEIRLLDRLQGGLSGPLSYMEWIRAHGGVDAGDVDIHLTLVGNRREGVRIMNMEPVGQCTRPLTGTYVQWGGAGGGPTIGLGFNLDQPGAGAQVLEGSRLSQADYFNSNTVSLKYNEQSVFQIVGFTEKQYCQFKIRMEVLIGNNGEVYETIGDGRNPFKVTAVMPSIDDYKIRYGAGIGDSPCLGRDTPEPMFGMIEPHVFCVAK